METREGDIKSGIQILNMRPQVNGVSEEKEWNYSVSEKVTEWERKV